MAFRTKLFALMIVAGAASGCGGSEQDNPGGTSAGQTAEPTAQPTPTSQPAAAAGPTPAPSGARVYFIEPTDGATVTGPLVDGKVQVKVKMGAEGIAVQEAGAQKPGTGHHHIIVDGEHVAMGTIVPKDDTHLHYGKGQSEADFMLAPGPHTLTMQFADGAHFSYGPQLAATIKINVAGSDAPAAPAAPGAEGKKPEN